jgi:hypothetical protein
MGAGSPLIELCLEDFRLCCRKAGTAGKSAHIFNRWCDLNVILSLRKLKHRSQHCIVTVYRGWSDMCPRPIVYVAPVFLEALNVNWTKFVKKLASKEGYQGTFNYRFMVFEHSFTATPNVRLTLFPKNVFLSRPFKEDGSQRQALLGSSFSFTKSVDRYALCLSFVSRVGGEI